MKKTITIWDGDLLTFRFAAAHERRAINVIHVPSGREKEFKNRTEFKAFLKAANKEFYPDEYIIEDKQYPQVFKNVSTAIKNKIDSVNSNLFADETIICLSGTSNFRDRLRLPSKYKGNREDLVRPIHLDAAKIWTLKNFNSVAAEDREADDEQIIKGYEYLDKGYEVILCGADKDSFAYSGLSLYDFTQDAPEVTLIPDFGRLELDEKKKVRGKGFIWFCFQWINGDVTDHFKPCEINGSKFGEMSAYKILKDCKDEQEALKVVVDQYKKWYPTEFEYSDFEYELHKADYKVMLDLYFKCCRMKQTEDDPLDSVAFLKKYGVEL